MKRAYRGFTLIELIVVISILAVLLLLVAGSVSRYRSNTTLNEASERLVAELQNAQAQARTFGQPQMRNAVLLNTYGLAAASAQPAGNSVLMGRIVQKKQGGAPEVTRQWLIGDSGGTGVRLTETTTNVPNVPLTGANDQGLNLEIGSGSPDGQYGTTLATVPFQPDGTTLAVNGPYITSSIYLGNDNEQYKIEISPLGKAVKSKV